MTYDDKGTACGPTGKPRKLNFEPIWQNIDDYKFTPLIDWHVPEAAFTAFRAHVSRYPGCDVKHVVLTAEEKTERGDTSKSKSTVTHVVISAEGLHAFHSTDKWPITKSMAHAVRFFDDRVAVVGKRTQTHQYGSFRYLDYKLLPSRVKAHRKHWRYKEADHGDGDPDEGKTFTE